MNNLLSSIKNLRLSIICKNNFDILEIGLGKRMFSTKNIIDNYKLNKHYVLEKDINIYNENKDFCDKFNINLINTTWEEFDSKLKFDGIFYDLDYCSDINLLKMFINKHLKPNGIFTYFYDKNINPYNLNIEIVEKRLKYKDPKNRIEPIDRIYKIPYCFSNQ